MHDASVCCVHLAYMSVCHVLHASPSSGRTSYTYLMYDPAPAPGISATFALILGGAIILFIVICVFFFWRYRDWCEQCFKKFLVADILVIFLFGCGALVWLFAAEVSDHEWRATQMSCDVMQTVSSATRVSHMHIMSSPRRSVGPWMPSRSPSPHGTSVVSVSSPSTGPSLQSSTGSISSY